MRDWKVGHDGPSEPMLLAPSGRIFCIQELGVRGRMWGNPEDSEELCAKIVSALNANSSNLALIRAALEAAKKECHDAATKESSSKSAVAMLYCEELIRALSEQEILRSVK